MSVERAFCTNRQYVEAFKELGLPEKLIYVAGRGAEDLESCLESFRGRPGKLLVAPSLTAFGESRRAVTAVMARLERARIKVVDVIHPQDETVAEQMQRAANEIGRPRFRDRRIARSRGREGGMAKGEAAKSRRLQIDTDTLIRNLVSNYKRLGWPLIVRILGRKISESTLRRHYLFRRKAPKKKRGRK